MYMHPTVIGGFAFLSVAAIAVVVCIWFAGPKDERGRPLSVLLCTASALLGYGYGILRFPLDNPEIVTFEAIEKSATLLISGYVVGKLDGVLTPLFKGEKDALFVSRFLTSIASFVIALIATFMARTGYIHAR